MSKDLFDFCSVHTIGMTHANSFLIVNIFLSILSLVKLTICCSWELVVVNFLSIRLWVRIEKIISACELAVELFVTDLRA